MTVHEESPLLGSNNTPTSDERRPLRYTGLKKPVSKDPESQQNGRPEESEEYDPDKPRIPGVSMKYVLPAIGVGIALAALDSTIVMASYGRIGTELDALDRTSWISTGYLLTTTAMQPLYGKLSDIFGRKTCLLFSYFIFGIGCLLCGISQTISQLVLARAFAGIGGGGMTTVASILLSDIVSLRKRGTWHGIANMIYSTGAAIGGPAGGYLADTIGWRWAFLGQCPIAAIAILFVFFGVRIPKQEPDTTSKASEKESIKDKMRRIDFLGAATLVTAISTLLLVLDQSTSTSKLPIPWLITLSVTSLIFWFLFIFVESSPTVSKEPFCPPHLLKRWSILSPCLANLFVFLAAMTDFFTFPLYCQAVLQTSAATAGKLLIPSIVGVVFGSLLGGIYMQKTGKYYTITAMSCVGVFVGCLILSVAASLPNLDHSLKIYALEAGITVNGFANGICITCLLISLIANVKSEDQAVVTAMSYLFRMMGMVLGVSVSGGIVQLGLGATLHRRLDGGKYGTPEEVAEIIKGVRRGLDHLNTLDPGLAKLVRRCYEESVAVTFWFSVGMAFLAFVASLGLNEVRVKKK